jgi:hypothetical protein
MNRTRFSKTETLLNLAGDELVYVNARILGYKQMGGLLVTIVKITFMIARASIKLL